MAHWLKNLIYRFTCRSWARALGMLIFMGCWLPLAPAQTNLDSLPGETLWLTANGQRIKSVIYRSAEQKPSSHPVLVVVLHLGPGDDPVAPPELSQRYAEALRRQGDDVSLTIVPGIKHNILLEPVVFQALETLVQNGSIATQPATLPR